LALPLFLSFSDAVPLGGRTTSWTWRGASTSTGCWLTISEGGSTPPPRWDVPANGRLNKLSKSLRERRLLIARMRRRSSSLGCRPYSTYTRRMRLQKRNDVLQKPRPTIYKFSHRKPLPLSRNTISEWPRRLFKRDGARTRQEHQSSAQTQVHLK
jgi:hypothetical protein